MPSAGTAIADATGVSIDILETASSEEEAAEAAAVSGGGATGNGIDGAGTGCGTGTAGFIDPFARFAFGHL